MKFHFIGSRDSDTTTQATTTTTTSRYTTRQNTRLRILAAKRLKLLTGGGGKVKDVDDEAIEEDPLLVSEGSDPETTAIRTQTSRSVVFRAGHTTEEDKPPPTFGRGRFSPPARPEKPARFSPSGRFSPVRSEEAAAKRPTPQQGSTVVLEKIMGCNIEEYYFKYNA